MNEQVTSLPDAAQKAATEAPVAARSRNQSAERVKATRLGPGFPVLFAVFSLFAVRYTWALAMPDP